MNFDVACYSEQGGRPVNEDAVFAAGTPGTLLTLVADGLGGMERPWFRKPSVRYYLANEIYY